MNNRLNLRLGSAFCCAFGVSLVGCATSAPPVAPEPPERVVVIDTVHVVDTVEVSADPDPALDQRFAGLQLQVFERDAQVRDLQRQLDAARQEVVRGMARLQTVASRAEAASVLAEAEIALRAVTGAGGDEEPPEATQALRLMVLSLAELEDENYGGALYLASQARRLARAGEVRLTGGGQVERFPGEVLFALSLPLETAQRSNVREGPGLGFRVLCTLDPSIPVVGHSHTELWVRITDDEGRDGWIFHSLVTSPSEGGG